MAAVNMTSVITRTLFTHSRLVRKAPSAGWIYRTCRPLCVTVEKAGKSVNMENPVQDNAAIEEPTEAERRLQEQIANLSRENESLLEKLADYQDKYQRTLADRENLRIRLEKQIIEAKQFGIQGFCRDLLEVSDVFRKAIESVPAEKIEENSDLKNLHNGIVMTETQLLTVFRRHGLVPVTPQMGDKFDPSLQEAMFELDLPKKEPGTVAHIIRSGWMLHSRCIRSAQVGVVKN